MVKSFSFYSPVRVVCGVGVRREIPKEAKALGAKRVFVVTGTGFTKESPYLKEIIELLKAEQMEVCCFSEVEPDPSYETVERGAVAAKEFGADLMVAFGGGSPMDAAKFINVVMAGGGQAADYARGKNTAIQMAVPLFCLPTTAGTASEVSKAAVVKDIKSGEKLSISDYGLCADIAFLDPEPQMTMPAHVAAATGMDALTHAIEGYLSVNSNPFSDAAALEAIYQISKWLRPSVAHPDNLQARGEMLIASAIAGLGFLGPGTGGVHSIAHILGGQYGIPHGVANATMLPYVMEYSRIGNIERFARIAKALGEPIDGLTTLEASYAAIEAVTMLRDDLGLPCCLEELGVPHEDLPKIAEMAIHQRSAPNNVRKLAVKDFLIILESAYSHSH